MPPQTSVRIFHVMKNRTPPSYFSFQGNAQQVRDISSLVSLTQHSAPMCQQVSAVSIKWKIEPPPPIFHSGEMHSKCRPHPNPLGSVHHHHMRDLYLINLSLPGGIMNSPPLPQNGHIMWPATGHLFRPRFQVAFGPVGIIAPALGRSVTTSGSTWAGVGGGGVG